MNSGNSQLRGAFMHKLFSLSLAIFVSSVLSSQQPAWHPASGHITVQLWPNGAPDAQRSLGPEINTTTPKEPLIAGKPIIRLGNVSSPTLTLYAARKNSSGTTVVVFPGGAYRILAIDLEGTEVCDWLNSIDVNCILLKYRVPNSGPYPKSSAALQDAQRAVGMVRLHAAEWHVNPQRIGVLGFSAGAHLAAALSTNFERRLYPAIDSADQLSCRPDFAVIVYPGYLALSEQNFAANPEIRVSSQTPPTFIVQSEDDPVHVENSTVYYLELKKAKVPVELHLFAEGGHDMGCVGQPYPLLTGRIWSRRGCARCRRLLHPKRPPGKPGESV
jgi:acetyl esterase/lipase